MLSIQLGVLGPLEIQVGGSPVELGRPKQRALLATLACHPRQPISVDGLVAALWGDDPPATARKNLQVQVHLLRTALGRERVARRACGYALLIERDELDAHRFRLLVAQARAALDAERPSAASELLVEADGLWRGAAFAGIDGIPVVAEEAAGLEEARLAALELRAQADLDLGRHAQLAAELAPLVAAHPLREALRGRLMVALYRSGRRAEALQSYRELRERLVEEHGLEPGEALRRLQRDILVGDSALDAPALDRVARSGGAAPAAAVAVPAQLPADVARFTGRVASLARLDALLPDKAQADRRAATLVIAAVTGTAGVGKTALAVHWAHRIADRFPDGQLYVDLRGYAASPPLQPVQALAQMLRALGVEASRIPVDAEQAAGLYRSLLAGRRVLVVLDDARGAEQVRPLLPGGPGCLVLVTSRDRLAGLVASHGAHQLTLGVLDLDEALTLLGRIIGRSRVVAEPDAAAELTRLCAALPLALRVAAANLACRPGQPIASFVAELLDGDRLGALEVHDDPEVAVRAAFDRSYAAIADDARRLFRLLGVAPVGEVSAPAAAALGGMPAGRAARLLDRLACAHLVESCWPGRFALHDLLRRYARERAELEDDEPARRAAVERLLRWYLHTADAAARLLYPHTMRLRPPPADAAHPVPFDHHAGALAWLEAERANLVAAVEHAAGAGHGPVAWLLADTLRGWFWRTRHTVDWLAAARAALAAAAAARDLSAQAAAHRSLGSAHLSVSHYPEAIGHYTDALDLARRAGWKDAQAAALGHLGSVHWEQGRLRPAAEHYTLALSLYREVGDPRGEANALSALGDVDRELGRLRQAADHQAQALALYRRLGARGEEANALDSLGEVDRDLGRLDRAEQHLTRALAVHRQAGSRYGEAYALNALAGVQRDGGRHRPALASAEASLTLARDIGDRRTQAEALNTLGSVHLCLGRPERAIEHHTAAACLARITGTHYPEADALLGMAAAHQATGNHDRAAVLARRALAIARRAGYRLLEGRASTALAAARLGQGRHDRAVAHARRALDLHRATGHRLGQARALAVLCHARRQLGGAGTDADWKQALDLFTAVGSPEAAEVEAMFDGL